MPQCRGMFDFVFSNNTGSRCWVAGWGDDRPPSDAAGSTGPRTFGDRPLKKVDVPIVPDNRCQRIMEDEFRKRGADPFRLDRGEICAGGEVGRDTCSGDGGAPLVCQVRRSD